MQKLMRKIVTEHHIKSQPCYRLVRALEHNTIFCPIYSAC